MKRNMKTTIAVILGLLGLAACGGGGGGGGGSTDTGPSVASLLGTWYGAYQYPTTVGTFGADVNGSGGITALRRNGVSQGLTGSFAKDHGNIFDFTLSDGTTGGFFADNDALHVAFLDRYGSFGVLQKGATSLPTYVDTNVVGSWSGYTVQLDSGLNITKEGSSSVTVTSGFTFTGSDIYGSFSGSFSLYSSTYGYYAGTWSNSTGSGSMRAWLSVDKTFAAVWACQGTTSYVASISDCSFSAWRKQ